MTQRQRHLFLAELALSGNTTFACAAARVTRAQALTERDGDPAFEREWRDAEAEARTGMLGRTSAAHTE